MSTMSKKSFFTLRQRILSLRRRIGLQVLNFIYFAQHLLAQLYIDAGNILSQLFHGRGPDDIARNERTLIHKGQAQTCKAQAMSIGHFLVFLCKVQGLWVAVARIVWEELDSAFLRHPATQVLS